MQASGVIRLASLSATALLLAARRAFFSFVVIVFPFAFVVCVLVMPLLYTIGFSIPCSEYQKTGIVRQWGAGM